VVHVEIDDRYAPESACPRMTGPHCHIVEEAKSHGTATFGMVAGRTDSAECVRDISRSHLIYRQTYRTGSPQRGFCRTWRHCRIGVDGCMPLGRGLLVQRAENGLNQFAMMGPLKRLPSGARRFKPDQ
jgi:hypothetical protein